MEAEIEGKIDAVINTIRALRKQKEYSQEYIVAKLSISQNAYSKVEIGRSLLTVERLLLIAEILEVDATVLVRGNELLPEEATGAIEQCHTEG